MSQTADKMASPEVPQHQRGRRDRRARIEELVDILIGITVEEARADERLQVARHNKELHQAGALSAIRGMARKQKTRARRALLAAIDDLTAGIPSSRLDDIDACRAGRAR
jgi:hypothetical protein